MRRSPAAIGADSHERCRARQARTYRRIAAVLAIAEGDSVATVGRRMRVDRTTVHRWVERYFATRLRDL